MDTIITIDLRTITYQVPPQEILTKDSVTARVDAVCYFRVFNPVIAVTKVENFSNSTRLLAATFLRNVLGSQRNANVKQNDSRILSNILFRLTGTKTLQEILQEKDAIAQHLKVKLFQIQYTSG